MKTFINLSIFLYLLNNTLICQELDCNNNYFSDAINKSVKEYLHHKSVGYNKYMVLRMKIVKIEKNKGEFVLSNIVMDNEYNNLNPSHYIFVDDMLILIIVNAKFAQSLDYYGIHSINDNIKSIAFNILAGPDLSITGQLAPKVVVKYNYSKIRNTFYYGSHWPKNKKYSFSE